MLQHLEDTHELEVPAGWSQGYPFAIEAEVSGLPSFPKGVLPSTVLNCKE